MLSTAIGIGVPFGAPQNPLLQLTTLIRSLGGSLYVPGFRTYEDNAGTVVASINGVVGNVNDAAGTKNATQATHTNKPLLKQNSGKYNLLFDNSNDYLNTGINPTSSGFMCVAARQDEALGTSNALAGGYKTTATIQAGVGLLVSPTGAIQIVRSGADGTATSKNTSTTITVGETFIASAHWTTSGCEVRLNGSGVGSDSIVKDAANTANSIAIGCLNVGTAAAPAPSTVFGGALFGMVYIPSVPTSAQRAQIRKLLAQIAGVQGVV